MVENKLKIFVELQDLMQNTPLQSKAYDCLKVMCEDSIRSLESNNIAPVTFSRWKLKARVDGERLAGLADAKELQKWVDDKKLQKILTNLVERKIELFKEFGVIPVVRKNETNGGKGNERLYWLDVEKYNDVNEIESDQSSDDIHGIYYHRANPNEIKISWFYKLFFRNGEVRNRSINGIFLISALFLSFLFWVFFVTAVSVILVRTEQNLTLLNLLFFITALGFSWVMWKYHFVPMWNLTDHRVIKAPMMFLALSELDADIEMYRDKDKNQITRFTRFTATCPICTADIILREGMPYQNAPLVGRCVESPFAHVYSFDRVTMKGYLLTTLPITPNASLNTP